MQRFLEKMIMLSLGLLLSFVQRFAKKKQRNMRELGKKKDYSGYP